MPVLLDCADLNDFSPGSCARINIARLLDDQHYLRTREKLISVMCEIKDDAPVDPP